MIGDISKRQQPDQRAEKSGRPPIGLQCSEKFPNLEASVTDMPTQDHS